MKNATKHQRTPLELDVSIIIPFFQRQEDLEKLLISLSTVDISSISLETIVIEDSTPVKHTQTIKSLYASLGLRFIFNKKNSGPGFCRNLGASSSLGKYLWFLDSDVTAISADVLKELIAAQKQSEERIAIGGIYEYVNSKSMIMCPRTLLSLHFLVEIKKPTLGYSEHVDFLSTSSFFILKSRFEEVGGFDVSLKMNEDNDLCFRLKKNFGGEFYQSLGTLMLHNLSSKGRDSGFFDYFQDRSSYLKAKLRVRNTLLQKHFPLRLIFLLILEPMALMYFYHGNRQGKYHLSRLGAVKRQPTMVKIKAHLSDVYLIILYAILGCISGIIFYITPKKHKNIPTNLKGCS